MGEKLGSYGGEIGKLWGGKGEKIFIVFSPIRYYQKGVFFQGDGMKVKTLPLPLDLPKPYANPSGAVLDTEKPYTLPLSQEIAVTRCAGPYTEIDRKLWATLVSIAWEDLGQKRIHEVEYRDISRLFHSLKGARNGSAWVIASAKRLQSSRLEWDNEEETGSTPLLGGVIVKKATGRIYFHFDDFLLQKLLDNKRFSRLRLHFMIGLSGKYSVSLYMLLEASINLRQPVVELSMDDLRAALNVPEGKLADWKDLNRFAIQPALKQINAKPEASGFTVSMEPKAKGRKYIGVVFTLKKSAARIEQETKDKAPLKVVYSAPSASDASPRPSASASSLALPASAYEKAREAAPGYDVYYLETEWREWVLKNSLDVKSPAGSFIGFCRTKAQREPLR